MSRGFYIGVVFIRRFIAASLVTVWLAFFGIEVLWASGLVGASRPDVVRSVEAALNSLTKAEISDDRFTQERALLIHFDIPITEPFSFLYTSHAEEFVKNDPPTYKLNLAFLL